MTKSTAAVYIKALQRGTKEKKKTSLNGHKLMVIRAFPIESVIIDAWIQQSITQYVKIFSEN